MSVKRIYGAALLRFYKDFLQALSKEPNKAFEDPKQHPVVSKISQVCQEIGLSEIQFAIWQDEIKKGFVSRNLPALSLAECEDMIGSPDYNGVLMDPRCFLTAFNDLANVVMATNNRQIMMDAKMSKVLSQQSTILNNLQAIMEGQARMLSSNTLIQLTTERQQDPPLNYNIILKQKCNLTPAKLYSCWFLDRLKESYEQLEKKTSSNRSSFSRNKSAMYALIKITGT